MKDVVQNGYLMFQQLHELPGLAKVVMGDPLIDIGTFGDLMQMRANTSHLLDNATEMLRQRLGNHGLLSNVGQRRIAHEWRQASIELTGSVPELVKLVGIEVAGDAVGVGSVHRRRGKREISIVLRHTSRKRHIE